MVEEEDLVRWNGQFGQHVVGEVQSVSDSEVCSGKRPDYCLDPDPDESVVEIEHWPSEDGVRTPSGDETVVHYERNVVELECEDRDEGRVCSGPDGDYPVEVV